MTDDQSVFRKAGRSDSKAHRKPRLQGNRRVRTIPALRLLWQYNAKGNLIALIGLERHLTGSSRPREGSAAYRFAIGPERD
jgi:hypothetical protein